MMFSSNLFGFGAAVRINVTFDDAATRKRVGVKKFNEETQQHEKEVLYLFTNHDSIKGQVVLSTAAGKRVDYTELICELVGQIVLNGETRETYEFTSLAQVLDRNSYLEELKVLDYTFENVEALHESYSGIGVRLRYFIRVTLTRSYVPNMVEEQEFWVQNITHEADMINNSIKMEVGIEDCLHIEFEYDKAKYHLNDVVLGKIYFLLVKINLKFMELSILRRETTGAGTSIYNDSETVAKYEIMDGEPIKDESIPVRLFLGGFRLTPTYTHVCNKFSTKYYLNLVLVDSCDRRYYKQQEIRLWRKHL
eukprot:NODE_3048_length_1040_cov_30.604600_g2906_i0.p1 GENE.NODE_3048_length_1040_cov_30.604600_g2906_i0~~NODE_3048_length_1040_cov_30.604600_g2906_i0.p1  ORF type:complete len:308 (+),score=65.50 NODE_3048_length_1040_cov_30.604600_g2906_i0:57-980(+)